MKLQKTLSRLGVAVAIALVAVAAVPSANATLLTYFNFNDAGVNGSQAVATGFASDAPGTIASTLTTDYTTADILVAQGSSIDVATGDPITAASNAANHALSFVNPSTNAGRFIQFNTSTVGFQNLILTLAARSTSTGFASLTLSYSTDGTTFTPGGTFSPTLNSAYQLGTFDLSGINTINGQPSVSFRLTFNTGGATTNGGTTNLDNIQLNAAPIPEPATVIGGLLGLTGLCFHQRRRLSKALLPRLA